jgi:hypothetical protein
VDFTPWSEEDLKMHKQLDELLGKSANWSGNTADMVKLYKSLVWFAQLHKRIAESIVYEVKTHQVNKPE